MGGAVFLHFLQVSGFFSTFKTILLPNQQPRRQNKKKSSIVFGSLVRLHDIREFLMYMASSSYHWKRIYWLVRKGEELVGSSFKPVFFWPPVWSEYLSLIVSKKSNKSPAAKTSDSFWRQPGNSSKSSRCKRKRMPGSASCVGFSVEFKKVFQYKR